MNDRNTLIGVIENSLSRYNSDIEKVQTIEELWYYKGLAFADLWTYGYLTDDRVQEKVLRHTFNENWFRAQERVLNRLNNPSTK